VTGESSASETPAGARRRRPRYSGKYPRHFTQKYKELNPELYPETVAKVLASGKTPAGTHRPILVDEVLQVLDPQPGNLAVDCTLGYGGHASAILERILPGGRLIGFDVDPLELPRTEARLRQLGFAPDVLSVYPGNFAGIGKALSRLGLGGVDIVLADLGVSSMQLDAPSRGFSVKFTGPLDMRMNPARGEPASVWLARLTPAQLRDILAANADEPRAADLSRALAGKHFATTRELVTAVYTVLCGLSAEERDLSVRRVFQALRVEVNAEFAALDALLRQVPYVLNPGGRLAILTFHSGEDRRVKKAFQVGLREGVYAEVAREVTRPSPQERHDNPRSASAKLRWARRAVA
jgi:16S rRNA (cytosine1402-N4)-methyltransferase